MGSQLSHVQKMVNGSSLLFWNWTTLDLKYKSNFTILV